MDQVQALSRATQRTGRQVGRVVRAGAARLEVGVPSPARVRRSAARTIAPRQRRRWFWAMGGLAVTAGGGAALAWRRPVGPPPAAVPPRVQDQAAAQLARDTEDTAAGGVSSEAE